MEILPENKISQYLTGKNKSTIIKLLKQCPSQENHSISEILATVARFVKFLKIKSEFWDINFASITQQKFVLALAIKWLEASKYGEDYSGEKMGILVSLASLMVSMKESKIENFSKTILALAKQNNFRAIQFAKAQDSEKKSDLSMRNMLLLDWEKDRIDIALSQALQNQISIQNTKPNNFLSNIRQKLGVTLKEEKPFKVIVLNVNQWELIQATNRIFSMPPNTGWVAYCRKSNDLSTMVIPKDWQNSNGRNSVEHEYIHSQITNELFGASYVFGKGLAEGRTESQTSNPESYYYQRQVWNILTKKIPNLEKAMLDYSKNSSIKNFDKWNKLIIDKFGLIVWSDILRMSSNSNHSYYKGKELFLDPLKVLWSVE